MRVLVVEDEERMAALLRRGLEEEAFAVDVATNGRDGEWYARESDYDAVILDFVCYPTPTASPSSMACGVPDAGPPCCC